MQRVHQLLKSKEPVKWLFYGDSITHGVVHTFGWRDYTELFSERVRFELGRTRDVVIKTAVSGNTTVGLLEDFDWKLAQFRPQVVFLMIGMNDCSTLGVVSPEKFRANLRQLGSKIAGLEGCLTILQTTCPILPGTTPDREPNFPIYMEIIREVAREQKLPLVDHTHAWMEVEKKAPGMLFHRMGNAFHPNHFGHLAFADLIFRELGIHDPNSFTCRLFQP